MQHGRKCKSGQPAGQPTASRDALRAGAASLPSPLRPSPARPPSTTAWAGVENPGHDSFSLGWSNSGVGPAWPRDARNPRAGCRRIGDFHIGMLLSDRIEHLAERYRAFVTGAVDIEARRPAHAARQSTPSIFLDATRMFVTFQLSADALRVQPQGKRVLHQTGVIKRILVRKKHVVHFPELALSRRGLSDLRGVLPMRMDLQHREMPERHAQLVPERIHQSGNDWLRGAAIWAFEIAVLHQRNHSRPGPTNVITCADRLAESVA